MLYLRNEDDKLTISIDDTPTTPVQYALAYKTFDRLFRRVVDVASVLGTLADDTPVDVLEIGELENKCLAVQELRVTNTDSATRTVSLTQTDGTTTVTVVTAELDPGYSLVVSDRGHQLFDETGRNISGPIEEP